MAPNRLGFAVKVLGRGGLRDHDGRRWRSEPHLRVSLGYLREIFSYLTEGGIRMYRISSNIIPYATHLDLPHFHHQIEECGDELAALGAVAKERDLRLSLHPSQYIVLNSPHAHIAAAAVREFASHAAFLDAMGLGPEAKIVTHVGGVYGDRAAAIERFVGRYDQLSAAIRDRLILENDEISYGVPDILAISARTGVPLVFDILHHRVNNPGRMSEAEACRACVATWPAGVVPKVHFSSQRTALRPLTRTNRTTGERTVTQQAPKAGQHDDWIDPTDFLAFLTATPGLRFDAMLEAKQKDLAVLKLREALLAANATTRIW